MKNAEVTIWDTVPTIWRFCIDSLQELDEKVRLDLLNNSLRLILVTGEPLAWNTPHDWRYQLQHKARTINLYSQSETTGTVSYYVIPEEFNQATGIVPLGKPLEDTTIFLLDENLSPVQEGEIGELCVAGQRQVRSYLNRPELTRKKFIINPFEGITHLYKTGDLARYSPEGILEFVGRSDRRIKIRGFRVELEGIETTLNLHPDVKETVVIARDDLPKDNDLVAYVATNNDSLNPAESPKVQEQLRNFIAEKLPEYAVPNFFVVLDTLPRNPNGKLERRNLPSPKLLNRQQSIFVSPRDELELELKKIWESVLETEPIGIQDNFFALDGHSLLAVRLFAKIEQIFNRNLPLSVLFDAPTIEQLANFLRQKGWSATWSSFYYTIKPINRDNNIPLSFAQERLWFLDKLEGKSSTYNIFRAWRLFGNLSIQSLEQALQDIVRRHESLRTIFKVENGVPIQIITPTIATPINVIDLQQLPEIEQETQVINFVKQEAQKPFDLESGPLLRGNLLQLDSGRFILTLTIHHIISDGWSMGVLLGELSALYQAFSKGEKSPLAELPIQYADYAIWQREWLKEQQQQSQLNYWKQKLANAPPLLELPTDRPRPSVQTFRGGTESFQLSKELTQKLHALSQESGCTLFMTLLAAWSSLLYRYSKQSDILVGTPIANRQHQEIEPLIGFFANTLVMRTQFKEGQTFADVLKGVRQTAIEAYSHQDLPFEQLVMELEPSRSLSYNPLFQVMFVLQNADMGNLELPEVSCSQLERSSVVAKFDLTLSMQETEDGLMGYGKYNRDLFEGATIGRWMGHFQVLLESIVANPQQQVEKLPLLPENEGHQILVQWNDTTTDYPQDKCIHQLFEEQVERTPDAVVVIFENDQLTYRELNGKANQLAHYLQSLGVEPEVLIGICVERSIEMIIGLLGILKAGGAYVPIDPNYPSDRLAYILEDSKARVLLTQEHLVNRFSGYKTNVVCFEKNWDTSSGEKNIQNGQVNSANLAYVIYTSGSTGKPKAVTIEHRAALNLSVGLQHAIYAIQLPRQCRVSVNAPLIFDASVQQLIRLLHGDTLYIIPKTIRLNGEVLLSYLQKQQIDVFDCTPSQLTLIIEKWFSREETLPEIVLVGGEAIDELIWQALAKAKHTRFYNVYGLTECTVDTTVASCYQNSVKPVIGHPIANTQIYILDHHLQPVPIGVSGELHIGGAGLARGYLNRPELTEQKFIPNPFSNEPGSRLYKTGDLARYLPDGNIEYIGRIDNQVKIRGFRIELGEIEAVLTQHPNISQAVVIVREDIPRNKRLAAYIVAKEEVVSSDLRRFLKSKLPDYMMPSAFVFLDAIPLTPSSKIDRRALPIPDVSTQEAEKIAPRTTTELQLVQIWSEVLNIPSVGVRDNFFDKGGHSLLAVRLMARIEQQLGTRLPLATLFTEPTIEGQASLLSAAVNPELFSPLVPIQPKGSLPPFFCVHPVGGNVLCYWDLARQLAVEQPFYGLQAVGLNGESKPKTCIEDMATTYIKAIQTVQLEKVP
ncbi:amino acid adenylation domain-containing protein [Roseofilum reptotaenium CS-1145]|nr:non-ribosomal peptide synthetase [Roseofilum reptotaenium]MDB9515934.1 amino acid adenylation domain-containing protein [Roseofilum reptotaenium CS-1145]